MYSKMTKVLIFMMLLSLSVIPNVFAQNGAIILQPVDMHFELVDAGLPTVLDVDRLVFTGLEYRNTNGDVAPLGVVSVGDTSEIDGVLGISSFVDTGGIQVIPPGFNITWEMTGTYVDLMDTVISVVGDTNTFITAGVGIFTLYVSTDMAQQANFVTGDGFDDGTIVGQFLVVEGGGGSYSIAGAFDGSRDFLAIKQSGLEDFFVPDISAVSFDSNLDADPDDNGVGGNDPIPTNWQYDVGTPEINFPLNFYATVDGSLRFGFIPTKSGCKFNDLDGDGEWDEGELGIPDWPIFISDLATGELVAETTTGPDGCYAFNVPLGAYAVCEGELFPNFVQTAPVSGLDCDGDPDYPGTGIGYVVNLTVENPIHEGNDFGNREEFVPGKCRMTGGSVTENLFEDANGVLRVAYEYVDGTFVQVNGNGNGKGKCTGDYCVTTGGQIGAPSVDPATGHWAHTQHGGAEGNFTFLSGTASAPPGTEISEIDCADEGWCVQARCAPFKQIFWDGVGYFPERHGGVTFDAVFPLCDNVSTDKPPARNSSLHYYRAMVGDFGDNKKPVRDDPVTSTESTCTWDELLPGGGPPGPYDVGSAVILPSTPYPDEPFLSKGGQECDKCPDYYQIEIYCYACDPFEGDPDCVLGVDNEPMYEFAVFIDNGNFQIHPETGDQCVAIPELFPALFDDTSGDGTSGGGKGKGKNK